MKPNQLFAILLLTGFGILFGCSENTGVPVLIKTESITPVVEANGELVSSDTAVLGPPSVKNLWQYKITFLIPEGTEVKKDQPVIGFDASKLQQDLSLKQSELKTSQKNLENTQLTNESTLEKQKLDLAKAIMEEDKAFRKWEQSKGLDSSLETKKLHYQYQIATNEKQRWQRTVAKTEESNQVKTAIAKSNVARIQAEVDLLNDGITKMTLKAPKAGIVIYKPDNQGKKVSTGDNVWMGRQIIGLPSLEKMVVQIKILEADAGKVAIGQSTEIVLDALPERVFRGEIKKLGKVFRRKSRDQPNIIFDAEISILNPDSEVMRPGMAARVKIDISSEDEALASNATLPAF